VALVYNKGLSFGIPAKEKCGAVEAEGEKELMGEGRE
jgi:hypothetical protein